jgi:hypothetical protein
LIKVLSLGILRHNPSFIPTFTVTGLKSLGMSITDNFATRKFSAETLLEKTKKRKTAKKTLEKYFITFQLN